MEYLQFISIWVLCTIVLSLLVISLALVLFPVVREHEPAYELKKVKASKPAYSKTEDGTI